MEQIIEDLEDVNKLEMPYNQLGMPEYIKTKIYILKGVVLMLNQLIQKLEETLQEWEEN